MQFVLPLLIAIVLGVSALAFVLYPFYRRAPARSEQQRETAPFSLAGESELSNGHNREQVGQGVLMSESEQAARSALHEIELDYQLGNISENDYRTQRERYLQRALVALKSRYDSEQALDDVIEAQLQKMKEYNDSVEK
jgi:hypothetical protein